jgi:hypothetical protein
LKIEHIHRAAGRPEPLSYVMDNNAGYRVALETAHHRQDIQWFCHARQITTAAV